MQLPPNFTALVGLTAPSVLEEAVGYSRDLPWVLLYWDRHSDTARYADPLLTGRASAVGYLALAQHPAVAARCPGLDLSGPNGGDCGLLVERICRRLYAGPILEGKAFVASLAGQWVAAQEPARGWWMGMWLEAGDRARRALGWYPTLQRAKPCAPASDRYQCVAEMLQYLDAECLALA